MSKNSKIEWTDHTFNPWSTADAPLPTVKAVVAVVAQGDAVLGPIDLTKFQPFCRSLDGFRAARGILGGTVDWVIAGGESGPKARPMHPDWARSIRDQCVSAGVAFFLKQWGGRTPKAAGRILDGRTWDEFPQVGGVTC